ncbi:MAG TPA: amino acid adenylation domain-containing protein [Thermoanaerobaculia bacterium]|nr:amino acid adenylation domain-containing protein [Thermoanaerobaculia bacterium]
MEPLLQPPWDDLFPLSFAQERFWFLYLLAPEEAAYNITLALTLAGPLDVRAYRRGVAEIVRRHEPLRTIFPGALEEPRQAPLPPPADVLLPWIDLGALAPAAAEAEARRLAEAEAARPFPLRTGPPFRAHLIRTGGERWLALFALHHIVGDGWSIELLLRELTPLYAAFREGRPSPLPDLPLQYADFAVWQRERLRGEPLERLVAFWRDELTGAPPEIELPVDRLRPRVQSFRGLRVVEMVPAAPLVRLARRQGATPFVTLLAGFQAFLHRVTGQTDLVVGSPVADRGRVEIEGLIGLFVNTLALRARIAPDAPFRELLERTKGKVVAALAHQDLPFEKLVEALGLERRLDRNPLFQVSLAFQGAAPEPPDLAGIVAEVVEDLELDGVPFDLGLSVQGIDDRYELALEYSSDLFDATTATRLLGQLRRLLAGIGADPERPVEDLPLLSAAEHHQLAREWTGSPAAYPREATLPELFAQAAGRAPDAVALVQGDATMTYGELRDRVLRLAEPLRALGVAPDVRVAVALPRSFDLIAALLAILEAGGAYVPVDASHPGERIAGLLRDSGAAVLVTTGSLRERLPDLEIPVFDLDDERREGQQGLQEQAGRAWPESLAYVMYTSGSTGAPKGVAVTHRNVARLVLGTGYARFGPDEVFLQLAPVSFDASTLEIWGPLLYGGRLVLAPDGPVSLAGLGALLRRHRVTTLWLTAGLFHQMVDEELEELAGLRQLLAGGDVLSPAHVRRTLERLPGLVVINGYGPTEGTTFSACHRLEGPGLDEPGAATAPVPIGRPIANTTARVLDASMRPAPIGTAGDLYVGGDGLARGYLDRPDLTAERFVPDPSTAGGRLYRTGDRARWLKSGVLEFLGRSDQQLKIAGWRIEPAEIEAALAAHPQVRAVAVAALTATGGAAGKRLAAWVAVRPPAPAPAALRTWLRERLPEPMVPSLWSILDHLPLTANGKVDRRALPTPVPAAGGSAAPATDAERTLAGIWGALLGRDRVGAGDEFFALGGNSLLALQAVSRIRDAFGIELPVEVLFAAPTPAALAARLATMEAGALMLSPVVPVPRNGDLPLSSAQERLWFLDRLQPGSAYNVPLVLRLQGPFAASAWAAALDELRRRHEALRTTFRDARGRPVQEIAPWTAQGLPAVDLTALPEPAREAERLAALLAAHPFELARDLPLRAALLRIAGDDHLFVAVFHHIVADAWSLRVALAEMREFYGAYVALAADGPIVLVLPEPAVQPADYAVWERQRLEGSALQPRIAWWRQRLAGLPGLDLPVDRPAGSGRNALTRPTALPADLSHALAGLARDRGKTLFMATLAAFAALLHRITGSADLAVGTPVANRDRPELEGLIGFFVNTLVLRLDLGGDPTFAELLRRVEATALAAFAHRDVPFDRLVEELRPERRADGNPLFQVAFSLDRPALPDFSSLGLAVSPLAVPAGRAKFDLYLGLEETADGIAGAWELRSDRFDPSTVVRLDGQWLRLVADLAADPEKPLSALALLSPAERHQVAVEWTAAGERVLDGGMRPLPIGTPGDLYLHDRRTGDRARRLGDGRIEILDQPAEVAGEREPGDLPPTPTEELLAGLWATLLGVERVGIHDDFFALGGHSLLATRLIARVHRVFGVDLPLRALFEEPTVAALAQRIAESAGGEAPPAIAPLPVAGTYPASLAQRRLWFLDRLSPDAFYLNVPHGLRLRGELAVPALRSALATIVDRHEPLRTTFETRDGQPVQRIAPPEPVRLPGIDLTALPVDRREAEARRLATGEAERPFDLAVGPLFRAILVDLGAADHLLVFTPHHLIFDGGSMEVLFRELAALYGAFSRGLPSPLPPLPVRFVEFAEWQRRTLAGGRLEAQLAWWRHRLAGLPTLDLPLDHPRPATPRFRGSWRTATTPGLTGRLEALGRRLGATPYLVLLAGFAALLSRLSGQEDVAVGSPVANRSRPEIEGVIGFFANTLVMRTDLGGDPPFSELLARVREGALGAWAHQDLPFELLVEELAPERHLSLHPLFQVVFSLQDLPPGFDLPGLEARLFEFEADVAHFDLTLVATRLGASLGDDLALTLSYKRDLFEPPTVFRLLEQLGALLDAAVTAPETAVSDLPLWSAAARHQAIHEWSGAGLAAEGLTADRLVAARAVRAPEALAIAGPEARLTYGELNRGANRLARRLRRLGIRRGDRVALALDRSPELALAALAVWKAGAAYLPLDLSHPPERLAEVVADAGAARVLTLDRWAGLFPGRALCLDADRESWAGESGEDLERAADPGDAAYVIYTSGSTGRPKGVEIPHAGLANLIAWHLRAYGVTPADRASLVASPAFDASVWELWPGLAAGASLHVPPRDVAASPAALSAWLAAEGITLAFLPTPLAEAVLARELPAGLALRALLTGGDRLRRAPEAGLGFRLVNHYGPTESSVVATAGEVTAGDPRPPAIGRPIAGVEALLLDAALRPVPPGARGEICLGGRGLAAGYPGHPEGTAERFVPHPFAAEPGARLYRTGDLARRLPDGRLEFAGRADGQIKIRGFRIEPGEVEARLAAHPAVGEAVVSPVDGRLTAWIVPRHAGALPTVAALRDFLRAHLPEPMVPAAWVWLPALPLTSRGKVDRAALPRPAAPAATSREAPSGEVEQAIERHWREVLGIAAAGRDDNFFDLGGHSLALAAVHERLQAELDVRIALVELFENPTLRTLAASLAGRGARREVPDAARGRAELQRHPDAWKERTRRARGLTQRANRS